MDIALESRCHRYLDRLHRGGAGRLVIRRQPGLTATTVGVRGARTLVEDGSPHEVGARLCTLLLLEARDLNDAIRVVAQMPSARYGAVEIRPIREEWTVSPTEFHRAPSHPQLRLHS